MKVLSDVMNSAENKNQTGKGFDIQDLYFRYTLASITEIGFGMDIGCITEKTVPFATYCIYIVLCCVALYCMAFFVTKMV